MQLTRNRYEITYSRSYQTFLILLCQFSLRFLLLTKLIGSSPTQSRKLHKGPHKYVKNVHLLRLSERLYFHAKLCSCHIDTHINTAFYSVLLFQILARRPPYTSILLLLLLEDWDFFLLVEFCICKCIWRSKVQCHITLFYSVYGYTLLPLSNYHSK